MSLLTAFRETFVEELVTTTSALGTAAPLGSVTRPVTSPIVWARLGRMLKVRTTKNLAEVSNAGFISPLEVNAFGVYMNKILGAPATDRCSTHTVWPYSYVHTGPSCVILRVVRSTYAPAQQTGMAAQVFELSTQMRLTQGPDAAG